MKSKEFFRLRDQAAKLAEALEEHVKDKAYPVRPLIKVLEKFMHCKPEDEAAGAAAAAVLEAPESDTSEDSSTAEEEAHTGTEEAHDGDVLAGSDKPAENVKVSGGRLELEARLEKLSKKIQAQETKVAEYEKDKRKGLNNVRSWLHRWEVEWKDVSNQLKSL